MKRYLSILTWISIFVALSLSGCGGGVGGHGGGSGDTNATSGNWDQMKWDQGQWK